MMYIPGNFRSISFLAAASVLALSPGALAGIVLRGARPDNDPIPGNPNFDAVLESLSEYIWNSPNSEFSRDMAPQPFVMAGSYATAVKAYELDTKLDLPYNDIDVYVKTQEKCGQHERIKKVEYIEGLIPNSDIEVNFVHMCNLDLEGLVDSFDINAVMIAAEITPFSDKNTGKIVPKARWHWDPAFESFLGTQSLEMVREGEGKYAGSFIRLIYKAQQSGGKYKIWDDDRLKETVHGSTFGSKQKKKLDKLVGPYKSELYNRFEVWEIRKSFYMLVSKGELPPKPDPKTIVRALQSQPYIDEETTNVSQPSTPVGPSTPANNDCTSAQMLQIPTSGLQGTTNGATFNTNILGLGFDSFGPTVWYTFVGTGQTLSLDFDCSNWNAVVRVMGMNSCESYAGGYTGSGDLCVDGVSLNQIPTEDGKQYAVVVEGYFCEGNCIGLESFTNSGDFTISLQPV